MSSAFLSTSLPLHGAVLAVTCVWCSSCPSLMVVFCVAFFPAGCGAPRERPHLCVRARLMSCMRVCVLTFFFLLSPLAGSPFGGGARPLAPWGRALQRGPPRVCAPHRHARLGRAAGRRASPPVLRVPHPHGRRGVHTEPARRAPAMVSTSPAQRGPSRKVGSPPPRQRAPGPSHEGKGLGGPAARYQTAGHWALERKKGAAGRAATAPGPSPRRCRTCGCGLHPRWRGQAWQRPAAADGRGDDGRGAGPVPRECHRRRQRNGWELKGVSWRGGRGSRPPAT